MQRSIVHFHKTNVTTVYFSSTSLQYHS